MIQKISNAAVFKRTNHENDYKLAENCPFEKVIKESVPTFSRFIMDVIDILKSLKKSNYKNPPSYVMLR